MSTHTPEIAITDELRDAIAAGRPVVALESTIITHGMPWPENAKMAAGVEAVIRDEGALPATIAVIEGVLHIGLDDAERDALAQVKDAAKLSRADLAFCMMQGLTGGTTVAATMMAAHAAGISIFATGGIGGVHRGAETSFDISADLEELARTPVTVICAGAKAILDLPKTLEALETRGVPVIAYGQDDLPAFWSQRSGLPAPLRLDDVSDMARFITARRDLPRMGHGGVLICNPVPEEAEIPLEVMALHIDTALAEAERHGIGGKDATPFLLGKIVELTGGDSLKTNIALVENNARLAARIAVEIAQSRAKPKIGFV
ncbi:MAG: pseudouridine-5'-phosphate glycosidase [Pseudomonadota bacterium]